MRRSNPGGTAIEPFHARFLAARGGRLERRADFQIIDPIDFVRRVRLILVAGAEADAGNLVPSADRDAIRREGPLVHDGRLFIQVAIGFDARADEGMIGSYLPGREVELLLVELARIGRLGVSGIFTVNYSRRLSREPFPLGDGQLVSRPRCVGDRSPALLVGHAPWPGLTLDLRSRNRACQELSSPV